VDTGMTVANTQSQRLITLSDAAILILTDTASLEQPAVVAAIKRNHNQFAGFVLNRENFDVYRETRIGGSIARSDYRRDPVSSAYMVR
jgi:hypothetical protein